jgi:hypothetical protein
VDVRSVRFDVPGHQLWGITGVDADEYLKGTGPDLVEHIVPNGVAHCGLGSEVGQRQLLFLKDRQHGYYTTGFCIGSEVLLPEDEERNDTYLAAIRAAVARGPGLPITGSGPAQRSGSPLVPLAAASALAGLALVANGAFALRRRL